MNFIVLDANSGNSHPPDKAARVATLEIPSAPSRRNREGRKSSLQRDFRGGDERASKLGAYSLANSTQPFPTTPTGSAPTEIFQVSRTVRRFPRRLCRFPLSFRRPRDRGIALPRIDQRLISRAFNRIWFGASRQFRQLGQEGEAATWRF